MSAKKGQMTLIRVCGIATKKFFVSICVALSVLTCILSACGSENDSLKTEESGSEVNDSVIDFYGIRISIPNEFESDDSRSTEESLAFHNESGTALLYIISGEEKGVSDENIDEYSEYIGKSVFEEFPYVSLVSKRAINIEKKEGRKLLFSGFDSNDYSVKIDLAVFYNENEQRSYVIMLRELEGVEKNYTPIFNAIIDSIQIKGEKESLESASISNGSSVFNYDNTKQTVGDEGADVSKTTNAPHIDKSVVCDDDTAKITVQGLAYEKNVDSYVIRLNIENKTDKTISYSTDWMNIDGFTFGALSFGDIHSGMNTDVSIGISKDEVDLAGIDSIKELQFCIELADAETNDALSTLPIVLYTAAYNQANNDTNFNFIGTEIYNDGGIVISARINDKPTVKTPLVVYVENNSDRNIMVNYNDIAINDKMVVEMQSGPYVLANTKRVAELSIYYFGDEPTIDEIESVTLSTCILPYRKDGGFSTADIIESEQSTIKAH